MKHLHVLANDLAACEPVESTGSDDGGSTLPLSSGRASRTHAGPSPRPKLCDEPPVHTVIAGRYCIEEKLGQGGMGRVYRVSRPGLDNSFALKLMHDDISDDSAWRRQFYHEARLASSLAHPNIVSMVDFGEDPLWGVFMVMEFLHGESLSTRLKRRGRLSIKAACNVMLQLADALHTIHEQGIVHGDIKPCNIFFHSVRSGVRRRWGIKVLDFGLAQVVGAPIDRFMSIAGTPEYMAPERLAGAAPTPAGDIYSLGVMMYQLLTGQLPFSGSFDEIVHCHLYQQPEFPSNSSIPTSPNGQAGKAGKAGQANPTNSSGPSGRLGPFIDSCLRELVLRALAKEPDSRHSTAGAFLYELRACMDMLGIGQRSGSHVRTRHSQRDQPDQGSMAVPKAHVFDLSPVPMAVVTTDGDVVTANRAFAAFLTGAPRFRPGDEPVADEPVANIDETVSADTLSMFLTILYPTLLDKIERVQETGEPAQVRCRRTSADGACSGSIIAWLTPVPSSASMNDDEVAVTIQRLTMR